MRRITRPLSVATLVFGAVLAPILSPSPAIATTRAHAAGPDFDGDGFTDLAIGVPGKNVGGAANAGAVVVLYGSSHGLAQHGEQFWTQDSGVGDGDPATGDRFGTSVATGDFNHDGFSDLAVGASFDNLSGLGDAGEVDVIYGSAAGLTATGSQQWTMNTGAVPGTAAAGDEFGESVAGGDFDGDGFADLAVGAPGNDIDLIHNVGSVTVLQGSPAGLTDVRSQLWTQNTPGIIGVPERADDVGWSVTAGDFDGDGEDDLAVGNPFDNPGRVTDAGSVNVLYGSVGNGLAVAGNHLLSQDTIGILGGAEIADLFGWDVAAGDLGGTPEADLAVGVPLENRPRIVDTGVVNVVYGSADGLTADGNQQWDEEATQTGGLGSPGDEFGSAVAIADFGNSGRGDLAVGSSGHDVGSILDAGSVFVVYGTVDGLSANGAQGWTEAVTESQNGPAHRDLFGSDVTGGDYNGDGVADLGVGVVLDDVGSVVNTGGTVVVYGSASGLDGTGAQHWDEDTAAEAGDQFGYAVA